MEHALCKSVYTYSPPPPHLFLNHNLYQTSVDLCFNHNETCQMLVDLYLTSLASMDYNYWYREHQAEQLLAIVKK